MPRSRPWPKRDRGVTFRSVPLIGRARWRTSTYPVGASMRSGTLLLVIWLIIGAVAAGQRGYYGGSIGSCTKVGTIAVTIIAGPLNYLGVNPKINCTAPKPSK